MINQPIATVRDLVNFLTCEDNESAGVLYLRGLASMLLGGTPSWSQINFTLQTLADHDLEVRLLVGKIGYAQQLELQEVIRQTIVELGKLYLEHQED